MKTILGPMKRSSVFRYRQSLHTPAIGCSKPYGSRTPNVCPALFCYGSLKESKAISRTKLRPLINHSFNWRYFYKSNNKSTEFRNNTHHSSSMFLITMTADITSHTEPCTESHNFRPKSRAGNFFSNSSTKFLSQSA